MCVMCLTESLIYFNFSETFNKTHILSKLKSKFLLCVIYQLWFETTPFFLLQSYKVAKEWNR